MPDDKKRQLKPSKMDKVTGYLADTVSGLRDDGGPLTLGTKYPGPMKPGDYSEYPWSFMDQNGFYAHNLHPMTSNTQAGIDANQGLAGIKPDLSFANYAQPIINNAGRK